MKKEEIYVVINSEEKRLRAIHILTDAGQKVWEHSQMYFNNAMGCLICRRDNLWYLLDTRSTKQEITLDQLEQLLNPKEIKLDALKLIAESYGFELVEKKREIKIGDFGKFFDDDKKDYLNVGFLKTDDKGGHYPFERNDETWWDSFAHLTDEEKKTITENW